MYIAERSRQVGAFSAIIWMSWNLSYRQYLYSSDEYIQYRRAYISMNEGLYLMICHEQQLRSLKIQSLRSLKQSADIESTMGQSMRILLYCNRYFKFTWQFRHTRHRDRQESRWSVVSVVSRSLQCQENTNAMYATICIYGVEKVKLYFRNVRNSMRY